MSGIMDMMGMMKKAQALQEKMKQMQEEVQQIEVTGTSGAGLVTAQMTGGGILRTVSIDPSLIKPDDVEVLQDLIVAAVNDARAKSETAAAEKMANVTKDLGLPDGLKLPF